MALQVKSLDDYIRLTENKCSGMYLNLTTVLALKKICRYELQYFNIHHKNGVAIILFKRFLTCPPSRIWSILAKDLIVILKIWMEYIMNYLKKDSRQWWGFYSLILRLIKELNKKDDSIANLLVEHLSESLFAAACEGILDVHQWHEVLFTIDLFSGTANRDVRLKLRDNFTGYFITVASQLMSCGHFPSQLAALEALMRWLVPRKDPQLRAAVATQWFPTCPNAARDIFLENNWFQFDEDARAFLNALNAASGLVTSVLCRRVYLAQTAILAGGERQWADINSSDNSISLCFNARAMDRAGLMDHAKETVVVEAGSTSAITLYSEVQELILLIETSEPPKFLPSGESVKTGGAKESKGSVTLVLSSAANIPAMDAALRRAFADKYKTLIDLNELTLPTDVTQHIRPIYDAETTRFSNVVPVTQNPTGPKTSESNVVVVSPSTASTTSLSRLRDRLKNIAPSGFDKKHGAVCAEPDLSIVAEASEASSFRHRFVEVFYTRKGEKNSRKKNHESDSEIVKPKPREIPSGAISDEPTTRNIRGQFSETDDSIINDTSEVVPKSNYSSINNIVDLLEREALGIGGTQVDSGIITSDRKSQDSEIDNTPVQEVKNSAIKTRIVKKISCAVISKSTTEEESNTEISETPFIGTRRKVYPKHYITTKNARDIKVTELESESKNNTDNIDVVEDFFSSHYKENLPPIDPALAKRVNRSNSESSEDSNDRFLITNNPEIVPVNPDFVPDNLEIVSVNPKTVPVNPEIVPVNPEILPVNPEILPAYPEIVPVNPEIVQVQTPPYVFEHVKQINNKRMTNTDNNEDRLKNNHNDHEKNINSRTKSVTIKTERVSKKSKGKTAVKKTPVADTLTKMDKKTKTIVTNVPKRSKYTTAKTNPPNNLIKRMSIIIEDKNEKIATGSPCRHLGSNSSPESDKSINKKKRKLYSSNDEINNKKDNPKKSDSEDSDFVLADLVSKTGSTPYKEIEIQKRKSIRLPRTKRSRVIPYEEPKSPRTLKNDALFDKVVSTKENDNKNIKVIDKETARDNIYNFTNDSEDENFEKIKVKFEGWRNKTKVSDSKSKIPVRQSNRRRRATSTSSNDEVRTRPVRKRTTKKISNKTHVSPLKELEDEKMREKAQDVLNTSLIISKSEKPKEIDFVLKSPLKVEPIVDDEEIIVPKKKTNKRVNENKSFRKKNMKNATDKTDSGTSSPLPGLIVETAKADFEDLNITSVERLKQLCQKNANVDLSSHIDEIDVIECENFLPFNENDVTEIQPKNINTKAKGLNISKSKIERIHLSSNMDEKVVLIPETIGSETDGTIRSIGVTGHGDSNESPPNPRLLTTKIPPREMVDLRKRNKRRLLKVNKDLYGSTDSNNTDNNKLVKTCIQKSSVVSLQKLSENDIDEWLSTRKSPNSDRSVKIDTNTPKTKKLISPTKVSDKKIETLDSTKSSKKCKSSKNTPEGIWDDIPEIPLLDFSVFRNDVSKKQLSSPDRISISSMRTNQNTTVRTDEKKGKQTALTLKYNLQEFDITNQEPSDNEIETYAKRCTRSNSKFIGSKTRNIRESEKSDVAVRKTRKSLIDPIPDITIPVTNMNNFRNVKEIIPKLDRKPKVDTINLINIDVDEVTSAKSSLKEKTHRKDTDEKSIENSSKELKSTKESRKRKSASPIHKEAKKSKTNSIVEVSTMEGLISRDAAKRDKNKTIVDIGPVESCLSRGASVASVADWVQSIETRSQSVDIVELVEDRLKIHMEKLGTIVHEVDENNTQEMKAMIIKFTDELASDREEHIKMLQRMTEMEQKQARLQKEFNDKVLPLLIKDCKRNRARVHELLQDVLEVLNHIRQLVKK